MFCACFFILPPLPSDPAPGMWHHRHAALFLLPDANMIRQSRKRVLLLTLFQPIPHLFGVRFGDLAGVLAVEFGKGVHTYALHPSSGS